MGVRVIAARIPVQTGAGEAAMVAAVLRDVPGLWQMAGMAGPCDVIARAQARDTGELATPVTSPAQPSTA